MRLPAAEEPGPEGLDEPLARAQREAAFERRKVELVCRSEDGIGTVDQRADLGAQLKGAGGGDEVPAGAHQ